MSKILITGVLGVIGRGLKISLQNRGHVVIGAGRQHNTQEGYGYYKCNVAQYREVARIFEKEQFDFVFHCAAEFGRWNGEDFYEQLWNTNAVGTKNIIRMQERYKFKLIHFSSSEVYGDYPGEMAESVMDTIPIRQMNDYAMTKWVNEMQIRNSAEMYGTESVIIRLFNTYGPGEFYSPYRSVNCRFCYCAIHGLPIKVFKGHSRTSTYLDDCTRTISNITDNFIPGRVYNIGGMRRHSIEELADIVWAASGANRNLIEYCNSEKLTTTHKIVNTDLARKELKLMETISLENGVANTINWMRKIYQ
jgi:dTDP-glucose 4,6-dehydratase